MTEIFSVNTISLKKFYCPLESLLLFEDIEGIIKKIKAPTIEISGISEFPKMFTYIPTTFPQMLFNFSETGIAYPYIEGSVQILNPDKIIRKMKFHCWQRCLSLKNNKILFTGGCDELNGTRDAFVLDIESELIIELPHLRVPRKAHSMAWINGFPSVIGGYTQRKWMKSVEIFKDNAWVKIESLNMPRSGAASTSFLNTTWVIGGYNNDELNSIEKYEGKRWNLLEIKLPFYYEGIGLCCIDSYFLIFGGFKNYHEFSKDIYIATHDWTRIEKIDSELSRPMRFFCNQLKVEAHEIISMGYHLSLKKEIIKMSNIKFSI